MARSTRNSKLFTIPRVLLAVALALLAAHYLPLRVRRPAPSTPTPAFTLKKTTAAESDVPFGHPYYKYSVIPGGAYTGNELEQALAHDPIAAAHYAGFDLSKTRTVTLDHDQYSFVSYRVGDRIYWMSHPILLHKGEKVLTDGVHFARARCGNRMSDRPAQPVVPDKQQEPEEKVFTAPALVRTIWMPMLFPKLDPAPDLPFQVAGVRITGLPQSLQSLMILPPGEAPPGIPVTRDYIPTPNEHEKPPIFANDGAAVIAALPVFFPAETPSAAGVPEPGTAALGALALACLAAASRRSRRKRPSGT